MSDNANPYESPQSDLGARSPVGGGAGITENMVTYLKESSPWIRFLGILGFIVSGIAFLAGIIVSILGASNFMETAFGDFPASAAGLLYIVVALVVFIPVRFLYRFGSKLRNYIQTGLESELEGAFKNSRSFWKFCGIITIIYLAALPVVTVAVAIIGVSYRFF
jgi:hypothetical protein